MMMGRKKMDREEMEKRGITEKILESRG